MALNATKISNAMADNFRIVKGKLVTSADGDADYIVFEVPRKAFIHGMTLVVSTALTSGSTGSVTIGFKEPGIALSASAFADNLVTLPEQTGTKPLLVRKYCENGGAVTLGIIKGNSADNFVGRVFAQYSVIH